MRTYILLFILLLSLNFACKNKKDIGTSTKTELSENTKTNEKEKKKQAPEPCMPIEIFTPTIEIAGAAEKAAFPIDTAYVENNCLVILSTNNASAQDKFTVRWNKMLLKSMPPQAVFLTEWKKASEGGDLTQKTLRYDLAPLFQETAPPVQIRISGYTHKIAIGV